MRVHRFGIILVGQAHLLPGPGCDGVERSCRSLPVEEVTGGNAVAVAIDEGPHHDDAVGLVVGQGSQQGGVNDAEYSGVRPDPQRQSQHRHGGEPGILPQQSQTELQIAPTVSHTYPHAAPAIRADIYALHRRCDPHIGSVNFGRNM